MKFIGSFIVTLGIVLAFSSVTSAQSATGGGLQQNSGAQPTAPLQNDVGEVQDNNPDLFSQDQSDSLKVYGGADQTTPAAEVGPSETSNQPSRLEAQKTSYTFYALVFIGLAVVLGIIYLVVRIKYGDPDEYVEPDVNNTEIPREAVLPKETLKQSTSKPSTAKMPKKKKKKKAHR